MICLLLPSVRGWLLSTAAAGAPAPHTAVLGRRAHHAACTATHSHYVPGCQVHSASLNYSRAMRVAFNLGVCWSLPPPSGKPSHCPQIRQTLGTKTRFKCCRASSKPVSHWEGGPVVHRWRRARQRCQCTIHSPSERPSAGTAVLPSASKGAGGVDAPAKTHNSSADHEIVLASPPTLSGVCCCVRY
jgi:hypothetical protein